MTTTARKTTAQIATSATRTARRTQTRRGARTIAATNGHRLITHIDRARVTATAGWGAADYLKSIGFGKAVRFASAFGRKVAETYRAAHNTEPAKSGLAIVNGLLVATFRYNADDMRNGALAYGRTSSLVAA